MAAATVHSKTIVPTRIDISIPRRLESGGWRLRHGVKRRVDAIDPFQHALGQHDD
jgi:hypothetical protein